MSIGSAQEEPAVAGVEGDLHAGHLRAFVIDRYFPAGFTIHFDEFRQCGLNRQPSGMGIVVVLQQHRRAAIGVPENANIEIQRHLDGLRVHNGGDGGVTKRRAAVLTRNLQKLKTGELQKRRAEAFKRCIDLSNGIEECAAMLLTT